MNKTNILTIIALLVVIATAGCAKLSNQIAADGGFFGSYNGDYVVRNDSGGKIMDVWVLKNVMVQETVHGGGWLLRDQTGNAIHLGGDLKVIRVNDATTLSKYHEYHCEFETKSYQELYSEIPR